MAQTLSPTSTSTWYRIDANQTERATASTWSSITRQAHSGRVGHVSLGRLPTFERGTPIINPRIGEARQPWLATHIGDGNSYFKPIARGTCWHCQSLLGHGSWISCHFLSRGAQFGFSGCGVTAFPRWFSTTYIYKIS